MAKNLVIVESPAKAKTIEKFLGKDYIVKSSFGHIRDLPKKGLNIDVANNFAPHYEISSDKKKIVSDLKKAAINHDVWLASDEDREGEAIAWHLTHALKLDPAKTKRIVFHEITKQAIDAAIKQPRTVDLQLVDAYQARRLLDRLVGYELSPVLWKKVRTGLSAGRVQSVEVRLIVEREREVRDFQTTSSFRVIATFTVQGQELKAELSDRLPTKNQAQKFLEAVINANFQVMNISQKAGGRNPSAPFTTSTLQQEASRRLGFSIKQTMTLAQRLYENGDITYMRTDSTTLSGLAIKATEEFITKEYGAAYHHRRQFKTKNISAQEAHEAIRPTAVRHLTAGSDPQQQKLYKLIWQRTLASQMSPAQTERTEVTISISHRSEVLLAKGEIVTFDGFMKVYGQAKDDSLLPPIATGQKLNLKAMTATETFSRPAARYSEAALVKKLEELGIGRPSTYASTISTIQSRGYIEKKDLEGTEHPVQTLVLEKGHITDQTHTEVSGADRNKLVPTPIAEITTDFLVKYFPSVVDYSFTANVEEDFDKVASGEESWTDLLSTFYSKFHPLVEQSADISRQEVSQARLLGNDPTSQLPIYARFGRYGPMLQRGETDDETKKPDFAPLPANTTIDTVSLQQALVMFQLPRLVGKTSDGQEIKANIGRFGPYVQVGKTFVSIKPLDPHTISETEARERYQEKLAKDTAKHITEFTGGIKVLNGPYGPYVTDGKKNVRLPKTQDAQKLSEAEAVALLKAAPAKKRSFRRRRSTKKA